MVAYASLEEAWNTNMKCPSSVPGCHPSLKAWAGAKPPETSAAQFNSTKPKSAYMGQNRRDPTVLRNIKEETSDEKQHDRSVAKETLRSLMHSLGTSTLFELLPRDLKTYIDNFYNASADRINNVIQICFVALIMYVLIDLLISR